MLLTKDTQTTAEILRGAAEVMLTGGYVAGIRYGEDASMKVGSHCALGAIEVAAGMDRYRANDQTPAVIALAKGIAVALPALAAAESAQRPQTLIADWNNTHCRTAKDVACVMRAVAQALEEESDETCK